MAWTWCSTVSARAVWDESLASLKPGGRLVITGTTSGSQIPFNLSVMQSRPLTLMGSGARSRRTRRDDAHGKPRQPAWSRGTDVDLADAAKAHEVMAGRDFFGKLVLRVP